MDLDNTLYPANSGLLERVDVRINDYLAEWLSLSQADTRALRRRYVETYGTTLQGLREEHALDVDAFLAYAHDSVPIEEHLVVDTELDAALAAIDLEKVVFTNAPRRWARRVLEFLQLTGHFRDVCDLEFMEYAPSRCRRRSTGCSHTWAAGRRSACWWTTRRATWWRRRRWGSAPS